MTIFDGIIPATRPRATTDVAEHDLDDLWAGEEAALEEPAVPERRDEPLAAATGLALGLVLSLVLWAFIGLAAWLVLS